MVNEVIIGAIAGAIVMVLGELGKVVVNIIRAKREPNQ